MIEILLMSVMGDITKCLREFVLLLYKTKEINLSKDLRGICKNYKGI